MDAVKAFNVEMLSMMDMKPPISRAKMMSITKAGIKAIKLYKHVVQIIEKFIKRCGPELKVPGLYVVDSIIRQSRHQFGEDKDVFGPRFLKNMKETFHSLYQCPLDDKAKILRVLNLWQKNSVFGMDVIQPLLDMAAASVSPFLENGSPDAQLPSVSMPVTLDQSSTTQVYAEPAALPQMPQLQNPAALALMQQLQNPPGVPQIPQLQNPPALPQMPQLQNPASVPHLLNPMALAHLQNHAALPQITQLQNPAALPQLQNPAAVPQLQNVSALPQHQNLATAPPLQNPAALAAVTQFLQSAQGLNLQQMLQTLQQGGANAQPAAQTAPPTKQKSSIAKVLLDRFDYDEEPEAVEEPIEEEATPAVTASVNLEALQQALHAHLLGQLTNQMRSNEQAVQQSLLGPQAVTGFVQDAGQPVPGLQFSHPQGPYETLQSQNHGHTEAEQPDVPPEFHQPKRDEKDSRHSKRSRSRSPRRRSSSRSQRSRSGSRSRRSNARHSRSRRSRSRSRERRRGSPRRRADDRRVDDRRTDDRQERERKQKGLPPIKRETISVCSTTLWIGQLDKKTQQQDVTCLIEEFGQIESVNMIPPRGCAYIVMVHRQDAYTALNKLSRGSAKINHKPFKIAWALNKGVNSRFKKYWDVDLGVTYIPWSKLKTAEIPALREGGTLDHDSFKPEWVPVLDDLLKAFGDNQGKAEGEVGVGAAVATAGPQVPVVTVEIARSPAAGTPAGRTSPHSHTGSTSSISIKAPDLMEVPSANPTDEVHGDQTQPPGVLLPTSPPARTLVRTGPGPLQHPPEPLHPFASPFLNNMPPNTPHHNTPHPTTPHPNMPHPNMPHPNMSHPNPPHPNPPHPNRPIPNTPHQNTPHPNTPHPNMPHPNMPHPNMPHPNMPHPNTPHPNTPHPNTPHPNTPHPNMPPMRMPQPLMPQGPMFRERPPRPAGPIRPMGPPGPLGPPGRFRMPMRGPRGDFPYPRERFPHPREGFQPPRERFQPPRQRFPHSGPMEEEHWDHGPSMNNQHDNGPNRGPEWFGEEPPIRRGGWGRGGPRGRGHF